jgi:uncharacterized protein involved in exopolysaccharide biosynthesis
MMAEAGAATQPATPHGPGGTDVDLRTLLRLLWSRRWLILASTLLFTALLAAVAFLTRPVYRATTVLVPANVEGGAAGIGAMLGQFGGLASLAGVNLGGGANNDTEVSLAVLRSREFTESFIRDRNLLPLLFEKEWDAQAKRWKGDEADWPTLAQGYKEFDREIRSVAYDRKTGLVTLQVDWRDPQVAADWANDLVARANAEMRRRAIADARAAVEYLEKELAATITVDTRSAISRLMESQIKQRMLANVTLEYAFRVIDRALAPDPKDMIRPKRLLLVAFGFVLGLLVGVIFVLLRRDA